MQFEVHWLSFKKSHVIVYLKKLLSVGSNTTAEINWSTFMRGLQLIT